MDIEGKVKSIIAQHFQEDVSKITRFDATDYPAQVAGEVKGFELERYWDDKRKVRELDRFAKYAVAATKLAFDDAGLVLTEEERETAGALVGVGLGGIETIEVV